MKMVIGTLMGIILTLYMMYYFYPLLNIGHIQMASFFNATDPTISLSYIMGDGILTSLPFIPILVGLFILFAYSLKKSVFE